MENLDIVLIMSLVFACCAGVLLGRQEGLRRSLANMANRNSLDMIGITEELGKLRARLDTLDRGAQRLAQRVDQLQLAGGNNVTGYGQAATLARAGASAEQLIEQCGITRGEAQLLRRLNA